MLSLDGNPVSEVGPGVEIIAKYTNEGNADISWACTK
jgi:hypothetical protein